MNVPKPSKPKNEPKKTQTKSKDKAPKALYEARLKDGKIVDIWATEMLDVGKISKRLHGEFPVDVRKKPFVRPDHLTHKPLASNRGLLELKTQLSKGGEK